MSNKIKVLVSGCNGLMGQTVCRLIDETPNFKVSCGYDTKVRELYAFPVFYDIYDLNSIEKPDVIIDFSNTAETMRILDYAESNNIPLVITTVGFSNEQLMKIVNYASKIPIFMSTKDVMHISSSSTVFVEKAIAGADFIMKHNPGKLYSLA